MCIRDRGKTTLFKTILDQLNAYQGKIKFGSKVDLAYYDQEHSTLAMDKTCLLYTSRCV